MLVNADVGVQLHPELWQNLPQELLEHVLSKLPVSRLAIFRRVCKLSKLNLVPRAACQSGECGECTVLLYFDCFRRKLGGYPPLSCDESRGSPWWMQVCKTKNDEQSKSYPWRMRKFESKFFPASNDGVKIRLWNCERGLLFFGLMVQDVREHFYPESKDYKRVLRDIVVCNPLTSQAKMLGLPCALLPASDLYTAEVLVGTVFDSESVNYRLVAAGVDGTGKYMAFVYDSLKSAWTNVLSLLPTLLEIGDGNHEIDLYTGFGRSVCFDGNLYWLAQSWLKNLVSGRWETKRFVLKFDMQHDTWRPIPIPQACSVCRDISLSREMVLSKSGILILHVHPDAINDPGFGSDFFALELAPEIKLVQRYTTAVVEASRNGTRKESLGSWRHTAFSHDGNFVYHVLIEKFNEGLRIIVQNTEDNSYEEVRPLGPGLEAAGLAGFPFDSRKIWSFSPSLKSVP